MNLSVDFPLILTVLVLISGIIALIDILFFAKKRGKGVKPPLVIEYSRSFFPVLLAVWIIRGFIVQPYRVPTGSLEPTVMPGDFIAVNQFAYGLRLPVLHYKIVQIGEPKRGDIALFRYPKDPSQIFVKRVIGLPGDHIVYSNNILRINGKLLPTRRLHDALDILVDTPPIPAVEKEEDLFGVKHKIFQWKIGGFLSSVDTIVPKGCYFMMGDNRDDSDDSRDWGFVPEANLIGKAFVVWFSWDPNRYRIRWHRIGTIL